MDPTISARGVESTTLSGSDWSCDSRWDLKILIINLLIIIITLVGLAGNAIVLWFLGFQMQRNAFSIYILNLAGADFIYLFSQFIFSLNRVISITNCSHFDIPEIFYIMFISTYITGLSLLSAISTERCLSVLFPIWFRCHRQNHISSLICALLWALSLLLSILNKKYCWSSLLCWKFDFVIAAWLIFSLLFLSISNLILLVRLLYVFKRTQLTRLYVTIGLTVLIFLVCGLPWGINWFLLFWIEEKITIYAYKLYPPTYVLTCINCCANPIIYFFVGSFRQRKQHQRQNLRLVLRRALQDVPDVDGNQGSPPQETLEMLESRHLS
ncbi:mas-related G-protein coupled receptor member X2-like [Sorex fumeus]|uniref:mas-related G-protein coupled receptor member X2-like n=1 Tax=Sorex fumeus TaxID=62283 RepID=UPI0024ADBFCD|nr:mas-related G-protein coupled receptor member X2-like [Sorex fumeus]